MKQALGRTTNVQRRYVAAILVPGVLACGLLMSCGRSQHDSGLFAQPSGANAGGGGAASGGRPGVGSGAVGTLGDSGASGAQDPPSLGGTAGGGKSPIGTGGLDTSGGEPASGATAGGPPNSGQSEPNVGLSNTGKATSGAVLADLEVTHSHFYVDPSAKIANTWTWLAVVKNNRNDLACDLSVEGTFMAAGSSPIKIFADVAASPYRRVDASSVCRCIAPGDVGVASGAALEGMPKVPPSAVTEIRYAIVGTLGADYVPGNWVSVTGVEITESGGGTVVSGTLTNGASSMPWWEVDVYPATSGGMPLTQFILMDSHSQLAPGATWNFQTAPHDAAFDHAYVWVRHSGAK